MDLLTLINKFENSNWTRETVGTIHGEAVSYTPVNSVTITINTEDVYTNIFHVCIVDNGTDLKLYINHTKQGHTSKYLLSAINTVVIS